MVKEEILKIKTTRWNKKHIMSRKLFFEYIKNKISGDKRYYIFIDEIQFSRSVKNPYIDDEYEKITFVDTLLSLMKRKNLDIYVTGSNSKLLSKDILTQF